MIKKFALLFMCLALILTPAIIFAQSEKGIESVVSEDPIEIEGEGHPSHALTLIQEENVSKIVFSDSEVQKLIEGKKWKVISVGLGVVGLSEAA